MTRKGWTTVAIPTSLYEEIRDKRVPGHSKSVQSYVHFWIRVGVMIDAALEDAETNSDALERLLAAISAMPGRSQEG